MYGQVAAERVVHVQHAAGGLFGQEQGGERLVRDPISNRVAGVQGAESRWVVVRPRAISSRCPARCRPTRTVLAPVAADSSHVTARRTL
ncbi:hypothetical protein UK15_30255 [Streptomyces variegatus]|uniref:Uncharacterized protein n=1 Tax=Streptomyces variegatus TaxID=284040 RepID=A0A0M2GE36_9ACTN|nr:hypothetical protein UK15_30255 [Streptomyces variegatus]